MARVARLAGALLAETRGEYYLVGNTKVPCDFPAAGFEPPCEIDAMVRPYIRLTPRAAAELAAPQLELEVEGEALPRLLASTFVIERTGSVSDRLWRLVTGQSDERESPPGELIAARWLGELPPPIWKIVRETVLRCS